MQLLDLNPEWVHPVTPSVSSSLSRRPSDLTPKVDMRSKKDTRHIARDRDIFPFALT